MEISGKTIIITGAARIGQEVARQLKEKGANLVISYFDNPAEAELGFGVKADLSKNEDAKRLVASAMETYGRLDALIHMAATYRSLPWQTLDEKEFDTDMATIAKSAFLLGKLAGDQMLKNPGDVKGKLIFFSDWSIFASPYQNHVPYNAAKAAVVGLAKSFAKELAPHVLVNAIAPGPMLAPPDLTEEENKEVLANTPLRRWGGAGEIAKGVLYLLDADFITGQVLTIDGGRTIA